MAPTQAFPMHQQLASATCVVICVLASSALASAGSLETMKNSMRSSTAFTGVAPLSLGSSFTATHKLPLTSTRNRLTAAPRSLVHRRMKVCAVQEPVQEQPASDLDKAKPLISKVLVSMEGFAILFGLSSVGLLATSNAPNMPDAVEKLLVGAFVVSSVVGTVTVAAMLTALIIEAVHQGRSRPKSWDEWDI
mmetsp:Transcript_45047/g.105701  ORF Transcript_45047/g.105701 Transcript_45047/m.105701 type:complete len:192 (-) Transcript_45047:24-599(-)